MDAAEDAQRKRSLSDTSISSSETGAQAASALNGDQNGRDTPAPVLAPASPPTNDAIPAQLRSLQETVLERAQAIEGAVNWDHATIAKEIEARYELLPAEYKQEFRGTYPWLAVQHHKRIHRNDESLFDLAENQYLEHAVDWSSPHFWRWLMQKKDGISNHERALAYLLSPSKAHGARKALEAFKTASERGGPVFIDELDLTLPMRGNFDKGKGGSLYVHVLKLMRDVTYVSESRTVHLKGGELVVLVGQTICLPGRRYHGYESNTPGLIDKINQVHKCSMRNWSSFVILQLPILDDNDKIVMQCCMRLLETAFIAALETKLNWLFIEHVTYSVGSGSNPSASSLVEHRSGATRDEKLTDLYKVTLAYLSTPRIAGTDLMRQMPPAPAHVMLNHLQHAMLDLLGVSAEEAISHEGYHQLMRKVYRPDLTIGLPDVPAKCFSSNRGVKPAGASEGATRCGKEATPTPASIAQDEPSGSDQASKLSHKPSHKPTPREGYYKDYSTKLKTATANENFRNLAANIHSTDAAQAHTRQTDAQQLKKQKYGAPPPSAPAAGPSRPSAAPR